MIYVVLVFLGFPFCVCLIMIQSDIPLVIDNLTLKGQTQACQTLKTK